MNLTARFLSSESCLVDTFRIGRQTTEDKVERLNRMVEKHYGIQGFFHTIQASSDEMWKHCRFSNITDEQIKVSRFTINVRYHNYYRMLTNVPSSDEAYSNWRNLMISFYPNRMVVRFYYFENRSLHNETHILLPGKLQKGLSS